MRITLTYLEFYSGIGGWGYAVEQACRSIVKGAALTAPPNTGTTEGEAIHHIDGFQLQARLLAAYDHSDLANSVFCHNHRIFSNGISCVDAFSSSSLTPTASISNKGNGEKRMKKAKYSNEEQFNIRPRQTPIERLTLEELQCHSADIWCMSPPCQPHTRQHSNQHMESEDARSKSFLHLCKLLCDMEEKTLPKLILLENVIGFEKEQTSCNSDGERCTSNLEDCQHETPLEHINAAEAKSPSNQAQRPLSGKECNHGAFGSFQIFRRALSRRNYQVGHFHLDPAAVVGIPNNRPRHYTVAFRRHEQYRPDLGGKEEETTAACGEVYTRLQRKQPDEEVTRQYSLFQDYSGRGYEHLFSQEFQLDKRPIIHDEKVFFPVEEGEENVASFIPPLLSPLSSFLDLDLPPHFEGSELSAKQKSLQIPKKTQVSPYAWCFDVATPHLNCVTSCFTHSYGKFVRGTGSILYTGPPLLLEGKYDISANSDSSADHRFQLKSPEERVYDATWSKDLDWDHHLRYFSGSEIARLMGFPVAEPPATATCKETVNAELSSAPSFLISDAKPSDDIISFSDTSFRKFSFPSECTMKQQWKLLGNSLNVRVAALVAEIGIKSVLTDFHMVETGFEQVIKLRRLKE